jgi:HEAT repeat protein
MFQEDAQQFEAHGDLGPLPDEECGKHLARLGQPEEAVRRLKAYLLLPKRWAPRKQAAARLVPHAGEQAKSLVLEMLSHRDLEVRRTAVGGVRRLYYDQPDEAVAARKLIVSLRDPDAEVRSSVADLLGEMRSAPEAAVPALQMALDDSDEEVRINAIFALRGYGRQASQTVPKLQNILRDGDQRARAAAASALKQIRGDEAGK